MHQRPILLRIPPCFSPLGKSSFHLHSYYGIFSVTISSFGYPFSPVIAIIITNQKHHKKKDKPLLTIIDRKISDSFECVVPGIHWGGLQALCLGIAVAALAVATVATGGVALVACCVGIAACGGSIASGIKAVCTIAHACDITTEEGEWELVHETVTIDGGEALLNKSIMKCKQGGVLNLIMDPVIARDAAVTISDHNMNQFYMQMGSQFAMGFIGAVVNFENPVALCVSSVLAIPGYFWGEGSIRTPVDEDYEAYMGENEGGVLGGALSNTGQSAAMDVVGKILEHSTQEALLEPTIREGILEFGEELLETGFTDFLRGLRGRNLLTAVIDDTKGFWAAITGKGPLSGGVSMGAFLVNLGIAIGSDMYEGDQEQKAIDTSRDADRNDKNNGISVIALTQ